MQSLSIHFPPSGSDYCRVGWLRVWDARGVELTSWMEHGSESGSLALRWDDAAAVYPVTVDPVLTAPDWSIEAEQELETASA